MTYTFRKIVESDKDELLAICSKIWEGNDFLPMYFDDWLKEEKGEFTAVLHDGKLIGCSKLTFLTETDAWLEGLRKDPDLELTGVARAVTDYYLNKLSRYKNLTSIRFASFAMSMGSIGPAQKAGFECRFKRWWMHLPIKPEEVHAGGQPEVNQITDSDKVLEFIRQSGFIEYNEGLICLGWEVYPYSDSLVVDKFVKPGMCYGIIEKGTINSLVLAHKSRALGFPFFEFASESDGKGIIDFLRPMALELKWPEIQTFPPDTKRLVDICDKLGFMHWMYYPDYLVFEYPVDKFRR